MSKSTQSKRRIYDLFNFVTRIGTVAFDNIELMLSIGPLKSVHLYRSRQSPLHHEFALLCLGHEGARESWVRVERAARIKTSRFMPTRDSLGPLFEGVPSRDSVSLANNKLDLCANADELAVIFTDSSTSDSDEEHSSSQMTFLDLFTQLSDAVIADPDYRLLQTNCRWFARRCVLSIAQRLSTIGAAGGVYWESSPSSLETLMVNLLGDRFGGRQMAGSRGLEIAASALINLANTAWKSNEFSAAEKHTREALNLLRDIPAPTATQASLIKESLYNLGKECNRRGELGQALELLEESRKIYCETVFGPGGMRFESEVEEEYARVLLLLGRVEEAIAVRETLIQHISSLNIEGIDFRTIALHQTLVSHASALENVVGGLDRALSAIQTAVEVIRQINKSMPNIYVSSLAEDLSTWGSILTKLERHDEAYEKFAESLSLTRHSFQQHPHSVIHEMAARVLDLSDAAEKSGRSSEGSDAMGDCVALWKPLCEENSEHYSVLSQFIIAWSFYLEKQGRADEALEKLLLGLEYERFIHANRPSDLEADDEPDWNARLAFFAKWLNFAALRLLERSDPRASEISDEAVKHSRVVFGNQPEGGNEALLKTLLTYAFLMMEMIKGGASIPEGFARKGRDWSEEAVSRFEELDNVDSNLELSEGFGGALMLLNYYDHLLGQTIPSLRSASFAFRVFGSHFDPNVSQSAYMMHQALGVWFRGISCLQPDQPDLEESIPYIEEFVSRSRDISEAYPNVFLEKEQRNRLATLAVWMAGKFQRPKRADALFQDSLKIGRRLFSVEDVGKREAVGVELATTLLAYHEFLISESGPEISDKSLAVAVAEEGMEVMQKVRALGGQEHADLYVKFVELSGASITQ